MLLSEMKVGKSIEIMVCRDGYNYRFISKLEDVKEDSISITLIANRVSVFRFLDTDVIDIIYRIDELLYRWRNLKGKVAIIGDLRVHQLTITRSSEGERFNRRNAFRVFLGEEVRLTYYVLILAKAEEKGCNNLEAVDKFETEEDIELPGELEYKEEHCPGLIKDLSENGVGIFSNHEFIKHDEIEFTLDTPFGMLRTRAEVVRKTREKNGIYTNYYGCCFTKSSRNLIKYIFELQRKYIKNKSRNRNR